MYTLILNSFKKFTLSLSTGCFARLILSVFQRLKLKKNIKRKKKPYQTSSSTGTERKREVTKFSFMSIFKYYKEKTSENTFNDFDNNL